jgi:hypothetical protein
LLYFNGGCDEPQICTGRWTRKSGHLWGANGETGHFWPVFIFLTVLTFLITKKYLEKCCIGVKSDHNSQLGYGLLVLSVMDCCSDWYV